MASPRSMRPLPALSALLGGTIMSPDDALPAATPVRGYLDSAAGLAEFATIDRTGGVRQLTAAKERHNKVPNPRPDHPRLWKRNDYRHSKTTRNYYNT